MANICRCGRSCRRSGLSRLAPGDLDFLAGPGPRTLDLPGFGRAGVQICYEIIFSGQVVDRRAAARTSSSIPSNDAWFGAWGPPQHLAQARLRAIEEGLPVIRATPTGICAVIDARGRLLDSIAPGVAGAIETRLPRPAEPTLFARFGNILLLRCSRLLLVAAAIAVAAQGALRAAHKDIFISALSHSSKDRASAMRSNYLLHVRIGFRRPSRQGRRPDFRRHRRSVPRRKDPEARVACETLTTTNRVVLAGEIRGRGIIDEDGNWAPGAQDEIEQAVRETVKRIGYEQDGFHWQNAALRQPSPPQSAHIAQGVDESGNKDEGAGDQGIMFGYACDETPDLMPATLYYSHKILERMAADRHSGAAPFPRARRQEPGDAALTRTSVPVARDRARRLDPACAGL